ncbi:MAG: hypothetical protein H7Y15_13195 [Pseudonocardia sp.]|nr:hypothetical protein [Pseudonocardia sp.]
MRSVLLVRPPFDADRWLGRGLHAVLFGLYCAVVGSLVVLVATWQSRPITSIGQVPWWSVTIAVLVVAATGPLVSRLLGRHVHQLVFGEHDDAYAVADRVYRHLHADPSADQILGTLATTLAEVLRLPYVAIEPTADDSRGVRTAPPIAATHGSVPDHVNLIRIPLSYREITLGSLTVGPRQGADRLSAADLRLLGDLARHVAVTLHAARLSDALQASREMLVTTREEERRRIRRDLHDGLGPTLASMRLQLGALGRTMRTDPDGAETVVRELREEVQGASADVRRLVYALRPPMLDEFGLVGALRNLGPLGGGLTRTVHAPDQLPPLPAALEVAIYRIAAEALHNTVRHAGATSCAIGLDATATAVTLTVTDDGRGLPLTYLAGVGHLSMHERATELGGSVAVVTAAHGGTRVTATFPHGARRG